MKKAVLDKGATRASFDKMQEKWIRKANPDIKDLEDAKTVHPECFGKWAADGDFHKCGRCVFHPDCKVNTNSKDLKDRQDAAKAKKEAAKKKGN